MTAVSSGSDTKPGTDLGALFTHPAFRSLWIGALAMNLATLMQAAGGAWLMVSLTPSPLLVALMQTASTLPGFIFSLPGGVLADLVNRRRLLLATQSWLLAGALLLAALSFGGWITPTLLLVVTAALGAGAALQTPAWHTSQAEAVPRSQLPAALALSATSYNAARAVGPALAGLLVALAGTFTVFLASAFGFILALISLLRWQPSDARTSLPPETMLAGVRSALRYVRHSTVVRRQLLRTFLFTWSAGGLWALLPLLARNELRFGAGGYGLLLGSLGTGAILGALLMHRIRAKLGLNGTAGACAGTYAVAVVTISCLSSGALVVPILVCAGASWMIVGNTNLSAIQTAIPSWVRARVMALYLLTFQGAMALGGICWGELASSRGTREALALSAAAVLATVLIMNRVPARIGQESEMTIMGGGELPSLADGADPEDGPVAVEISYRVRAEVRGEFTRAMQALGKARRRDGANVWRLYRSVSDPAVHVERFLIDSWAEYLRHRARTTVADSEAQRLLLPLLVAGETPEMRCYVAARCAATD